MDSEWPIQAIVYVNVVQASECRESSQCPDVLRPRQDLEPAVGISHLQLSALLASTCGQGRPHSLLASCFDLGSLFQLRLPPY